MTDDQGPPAHHTARERARAEITREIVNAGRAQLSQVGPAELSLRAVARELGMVSSAVYRYFPSRDDLLTALLVDVYGELGDAVEKSGRGSRRTPRKRFVAYADAVRSWARAHPHDYALLYGTPVHGYSAPQPTVAVSSRIVGVLVDIVADAWRAGARPTRGEHISRALHAGVSGVRTFVVDRGHDEPDDQATVRAVMAWTTIFGTVSFELWGQFATAITDVDAYYAAVVQRLADNLALP